MATIKYTIDVPREAVPELEILMNKHGAYFDSRRQITAINDTLMESSTAMGHHAPDLIESLNQHLDRSGLEPLVPTDHKEWSLERLQAFLNMAVNNVQWVDNHVESDWWEEEGKTWQEVVQENPMVFGA